MIFSFSIKKLFIIIKWSVNGINSNTNSCIYIYIYINKCNIYIKKNPHCWEWSSTLSAIHIIFVNLIPAKKSLKWDLLISFFNAWGSFLLSNVYYPISENQHKHKLYLICSFLVLWVWLFFGWLWGFLPPSVFYYIFFFNSSVRIRNWALVSITITHWFRV